MSEYSYSSSRRSSPNPSDYSMDDLNSNASQSSNNVSSKTVHRTLLPEEDPGPGVVEVQISDSDTVYQMEKRSLSLKSEYFRSSLSRFHHIHPNSDRKVKLNADFVSSEAWEVLKIYFQLDELQIYDEVRI